MAESDIQRALDEVVEFIRALPIPGDCCDDLLVCRNALTPFVREAVPGLVRKYPILLVLFAATSTDQLSDCLVDLAVRTRCGMEILSSDEEHRLRQLGLSPHGELLLRRLRERLKYDDASTWRVTRCRGG